MTTKILPILLACSAISVSAANATFESEGLYIDSEKMAVEKGSYLVTGAFELSGSESAIVILGLGAYDASGAPLHAGNYFAAPTEDRQALLELAAFELGPNAKRAFAMKVNLSGDDLAAVAFAVDVNMQEGNILKLIDLTIEPNGDGNDGDGSDSSSGNKTEGGVNVAIKNNGGIKGGETSLSDQLKVESVSADKLQMQVANAANGLVFVDSAIGTDTNTGTSAAPFKTLGVALASGADQVIMNESGTAYAAASIKPLSGSTVIIRPNGIVTIKGQ